MTGLFPGGHVSRGNLAEPEVVFETPEVFPTMQQTFRQCIMGETSKAETLPLGDADPTLSLTSNLIVF